MHEIILIAQLAIAFGILNVWCYRPNRPTRWRGGNAKTMREEFAHYGLPYPFMLMIGFLKVTSAIMLILGVFIPAFTLPGVVLLTVLLLGAIMMHVKVHDPIYKVIPSLSLFTLCLVVSAYIISHFNQDSNLYAIL